MPEEYRAASEASSQSASLFATSTPESEGKRNRTFIVNLPAEEISRWNTDRICAMHPAHSGKHQSCTSQSAVNSRENPSCSSRFAVGLSQCRDIKVEHDRSTDHRPQIQSDQ